MAAVYTSGSPKEALGPHSRCRCVRLRPHGMSQSAFRTEGGLGPHPGDAAAVQVVKERRPELRLDEATKGCGWKACKVSADRIMS